MMAAMVGSMMVEKVTMERATLARVTTARVTTARVTERPGDHVLKMLFFCDSSDCIF